MMKQGSLQTDEQNKIRKAVKEVTDWHAWEATYGEKNILSF